MPLVLHMLLKSGNFNLPTVKGIFNPQTLQEMLFVYYDNRYHTQTVLYLANGTQTSPRRAQQLSIPFHFTGVHLPLFLKVFQ